MLARALKLAAHAASIGEVPVGAVVYRTDSGKVLAEAHNRRELDSDPSAHAEHAAIVAAAKAEGDWRLNHCTVAVTLEPCAMCAGLIVNARVGRLVFAAADPKAGACGSVLDVVGETKLNHQPVVLAGASAGLGDEADRAGQLLRDFFRSRRS